MATLLYNMVFWIVFLFTIHKIYYEGVGSLKQINYLNIFQDVSIFSKT